MVEAHRLPSFEFVASNEHAQQNSSPGKRAPKVSPRKKARKSRTSDAWDQAGEDLMSDQKPQPIGQPEVWATVRSMPYASSHANEFLTQSPGTTTFM